MNSKKNKFTEKQFIFYGLNFIVGFGFIATISSVISRGLWGILIFALTAFISMTVMLAFARASQSYGKEVGGTYVYAKKAFSDKRKILFLQGWNQFSQVPLFSATTPLFFIDLLKEIDSGNQTIYQICALVFFVLLNVICSFGIKTSKWFILFTGIIKWLTIGLGLSIVTFYSFSTLSFGANFKNTPNVDISIIVTSVLSFIYAFAGGEGLAGVSSEVETKRFKKIIMLIFGIVLIFYFTFYIVYLGLDSTVFNESTSISFALIFKVSLGSVGVILFIIGTFFNRVGAGISSIIYYARTVVPLAQDDFIPGIFAKKSKKTGEYRNAILFQSAFSIISMIIFTIIPYFLGIKDQFSAILNAGNIVFLMQYLFTICTLLYLSWKRKEFVIPVWEKIVYICSIILISFIVLTSLIPPIIGTSYTAESALLLPSYMGIMLIGYLIWGGWYLIKKKWPNNRFVWKEDEIMINNQNKTMSSPLIYWSEKSKKH
ncbi:APC family permease [Mycoplasmopsis cynos]|uniref:Amino acid permease n=1 Tax=Mycoplasmopsis cynos (strain C142) TaxID=1246955 RepID=L0RWG2_MYCC1|nr:APC family permease [Mycoplasmopsis cynos]WQQ14435.1 APC family permease [Mycoplasmopsis cynos]WQQ15307.1 APC family permease [Mycoplasmopsis cynos]WQQ16361.1 APC family permease [Mycoplasmopsis cynos]WQQ18759.1 APC family permease [Mycoplasmopsis cynos]CCP23900.1 Amino acid permease [Mycoplasmopsis cynos C142]